MRRQGLTMLGALGLGALTMYLLDPDRGRRRRGMLRDKTVRLGHDVKDAIGPAARDVANRAQGLAASARQLVRGEEVPDPVLGERVRAALGRVVSHPRAIEVAVWNGHVTLYGPVLAAEAGRLLRTVKGVRGVRSLDDQLERHPDAGGHPSLQGSATMPASRNQWPPAARVLSGLAGGMLAYYAAQRRDRLSVVLGAAGVSLLSQAAANRPLRQLARRTSDSAVTIEKTIHIAAPPDVVFGLWCNYENFPRFMSHVREVRDLGGGRSHWVVDGPVGTTVEWDADITEWLPDRLMAWRSLPGAAVENEGAVRLTPGAEGGTRVDVHLRYTPPAGAVGRTLASVFRVDPKRQMDDDLMRMKTFIETGVPPRDAAQAPAQAGVH